MIKNRHRGGHRLYRCGTAADSRAAPRSAACRDHLAQGSGYGGCGDVSEPARQRVACVFRSRIPPICVAAMRFSSPRPTPVAMAQAAALLDSGVRVIDLSADFRIRDVAEWEKWYGTRHAAPGAHRAGGIRTSRSPPRTASAMRVWSPIPAVIRRRCSLVFCHSSRQVSPIWTILLRREVRRVGRRPESRDELSLFGGFRQLQGLWVNGHRTGRKSVKGWGHGRTASRADVRAPSDAMIRGIHAH